MSQLTKSVAAAAALGATLALGMSIGAAMADQPHMHSALDHLRAARAELVDASADKGGHRGRAIRLVNAAIDEVQAGISFDRRH